MGNGNVLERVFKLETQINKLLVEGKRDPVELAKLLQGFLEQKTFAAWRRVCLGMYTSPLMYVDLLQTRRHFQLGVRSKRLLSDIDCAQKRTILELAAPLVSELGFGGGARYGEVCERALEYGLHLCPPEMGPALRLQYIDQPCAGGDERVVIAMRPLRTENGDLLSFILENKRGELWLGVDFGDHDIRLHNSTRVVFVKSFDLPDD